MTINEIMQQIENIRFEIKYSVATSLDSMLFGMQSDEYVEELTTQLQDKASQVTILERIMTLIQDYALGVIHPHDVIIVAYLFSLKQANSLGTLEKAVNLVFQTPTFYWAHKYSERLLREIESVTHNQFTELNTQIEVITKLKILKTDVVVIDNIPA